MKVFEHYLYIQGKKFVEVLLYATDAMLLVYSADDIYSGEYATNMTVGAAKATGLFNPEAEQGETDPETDAVTNNEIPAGALMEYAWLLPTVQEIVGEVYARTKADYAAARDKIESFPEMPLKIVDLMEYAPRGFTNQTVFIYTTKDEHDDFLKWKESLLPNQIIRYFSSANWDFRNQLIPWQKDNLQKQVDEPNSDYAVSPMPWKDVIKD
jgi:hypothetical protein